MPMIRDLDGNALAEIPLSEKQQRAIDDGTEIVVLFTTPQLLRSLLGEEHGSFRLRRKDENIVVDDPAILKKFVELQKAIRTARENS